VRILKRLKVSPERREEIKNVFLSLKNATPDDSQELLRLTSPMISPRDGSIGVYKDTDIEDFLNHLPEDPRNPSVLELDQGYHGLRAK